MGREKMIVARLLREICHGSPDFAISTQRLPKYNPVIADGMLAAVSEFKTVIRDPVAR
jgi:hypothetical protein